MTLFFFLGCGLFECNNLDNLTRIVNNIPNPVVLVCVGEPVFAETDGNVDDLTISPSQVRLVQHLLDLKKQRNTPLHIILLLVQGRPRILPPDIVTAASAILHTYLPGPCKFSFLHFFL